MTSDEVYLAREDDLELLLGSWEQVRKSTSMGIIAVHCIGYVVILAATIPNFGWHVAAIPILALLICATQLFWNAWLARRVAGMVEEKIRSNPQVRRSYTVDSRQFLN